MGSAAISSTLRDFRLINSALAQGPGAGGFDDYKALVCVFLFGGNDSWNMVVPTSTAEYNAYSRSRGGGSHARCNCVHSANLRMGRDGGMLRHSKKRIHAEEPVA